jgi:quinol monooxygenase YgiN
MNGGQMITIDQNNQVLTVINVLTVEPERHEALLELLMRTTEEVTSHHAGYISTSLHLNPLRNRVVNYSQWASRADFEAMASDPAVQESMQAVRQLAVPEPRHYEVVWTHTARRG